MLYVLTGFVHDGQYRVYRFDGLAPHQERVPFTVRADLSLLRRYSIQIQDLPLLCRTVLEERVDTDEERTLTFTERQMRVLAEARLEAKNAAAAKRRPIRARAAVVG
ncbi:MAG: hypothetical protein K2Q23_08580 [Bryobacteraceae bacterium]|nr:hypothetical protein [Bryobacteraceae bacterium]